MSPSRRTTGPVRAALGRAGACEACEAAFLCGCDGAHSAVRHGAGLDSPGGRCEQPFLVSDNGIAGAFERFMVASLGAGGLAPMFPVRASGMQRLIGNVPGAPVGALGGALGDRPDLGLEDLRPPVEQAPGPAPQR